MAAPAAPEPMIKTSVGSGELMIVPSPHPARESELVVLDRCRYMSRADDAAAAADRSRPTAPWRVHIQAAVEPRGRREPDHAESPRSSRAENSSHRPPAAR